MSKLKDKLSANMRAVKANQHVEKTPAPAKPAAAPATPKATPVATKKKSEAVASGNVVPENSGTTLFPTRVWPD